MTCIDEALCRLRGAAASKLVYAVVLLAAAISAGHVSQAQTLREVPRAIEWPQRWDMRELRPLAQGDIERRFAARFPGALAKLTDGERQYVMRYIDQPTRMLHPAADCYRGSGYRIEATRLERDAQARDWRCFEAVRAGRRTRVCERITDAEGRAFTDTSAWFWAALTARSKGPWLAVTTAQPL